MGNRARDRRFALLFKPTKTIVIPDLAVGSIAAETPSRARSVRGTRHSVIVADVGSNPAGSILQVCGGEVLFEERRQRYLLKVT
jgi:hypothetical protein